MLLKHHYPLPTPQSPFPPINWGENICSSAEVPVLESCKQQRRGWAWPRGASKQCALCLRAHQCLPDCASLGLVLLPEGRAFIKPSWHILGLFPPPVHTCLLPGGHVTGYKVMVIPRLSALSLGRYK